MKVFKILLIFILINLGMQIIAKEVASNEVDFTVYISSDNVRIREKPSVDSGIINILKIGTQVKCLKVTTNKYKVGNNENYWYFCSMPMIEFGWIYGQFISKEKFDYNSYIKKLEKPINNSEDFNLLRNKSWTQCKTGKDNWGCPYITILDKVIIMGADIWGKAYYIKNINMNNNKIIIKGELLFSWRSVNNSNENLDLTLTIDKNNFTNIKVNNENYYLFKKPIIWWIE